MRLTCIFLLSVLVVLQGSFFRSNAQQTNQAAQEPTIFTSSTLLVVETVTVNDKSGKAIEGLTAKDFTVTEDGAPQTIKFFEFQKLDEVPEPLPPCTTTPGVLQRFPATKISPETPGNTKYRDHRLLAMYFDLTALPPSDQIRALDGAQKFIRTQMTSADLMAIMLFQGGAVRVLQDFTGDRDRLLTDIETVEVGEGQ